MKKRNKLTAGMEWNEEEYVHKCGVSTKKKCIPIHIEARWVCVKKNKVKRDNETYTTLANASEVYERTKIKRTNETTERRRKKIEEELNGAEKSKSWPPQILNSIFHSSIFRSKNQTKIWVNYTYTKIIYGQPIETSGEDGLHRIWCYPNLKNLYWLEGSKVGTIR